MKRVEAATGELEETITDLRRTVAWMDLAISQLREGIVVVNEDEFRIAYANDAFAKMTGKPRILILGGPVGKHLPSLREASKAIRASPSTFSDTVIGAGGKRQKVAVRFTRLPFGRQSVLLVSPQS